MRLPRASPACLQSRRSVYRAQAARQGRRTPAGGSLSPRATPLGGRQHLDVTGQQSWRHHALGGRRSDVDALDPGRWKCLVCRLLFAGWPSPGFGRARSSRAPVELPGAGKSWRIEGTSRDDPCRCLRARWQVSRIRLLRRLHSHLDTDAVGDRGTRGPRKGRKRRKSFQ